MDKIDESKLIKSIFSFLEAVHGKNDPVAVSSVVRNMIEVLLNADERTLDTQDKNSNIPWARLNHDLRSPMNGILGFVEILMEECKDDENKWKLEQIRSSAIRLMKLLEAYSLYGFSIENLPAFESATVHEPQTIEAAAHPVPQKKKAKSAGMRKFSILIVEDNMVNSNLLMQHLKKHYHLFFSQTGKAAVEVAKCEKIDAILMDINLGPGITGSQAMHEIREQIGHEKMPVIAVTGYASKADREKFLEEGFDEFIAKPFERHEILEALERVLGKSVKE